MKIRDFKSKLEHLPEDMEMFMETEEGLLDILSVKIKELNFRHPDDPESQEPILEKALILSDNY